MTDDDALTAAIHLELGHARSAHSAARLLRDAELYNDALNRLYYALYHVLHRPVPPTDPSRDELYNRGHCCAAGVRLPPGLAA